MCLDRWLILLKRFIPMIHARVVQARNLKNAVENMANYKLI